MNPIWDMDLQEQGRTSILFSTVVCVDTQWIPVTWKDKWLKFVLCFIWHKVIPCITWQRQTCPILITSCSSCMTYPCEAHLDFCLPTPPSSPGSSKNFLLGIGPTPSTCHAPAVAGSPTEEPKLKQACHIWIFAVLTLVSCPQPGSEQSKIWVCKYYTWCCLQLIPLTISPPALISWDVIFFYLWFCHDY